MSAYKNVPRNLTSHKEYTFISDANSLPRSAILNRSQYTQSTRVRRIVLANKNSLNNAIEVLSSTGENPVVKASQFVTNETQSLSELPLIKKPFKHYKQSSNSFKSLNRSISVTPLEKRSETSSISTLKSFAQPNKINRNLASNPSTSLILKTANVLNEFVDYFEKYKMQNPLVQIGSFKNRRSTKYSGLKPLFCVDNKGPTIDNCMGIIKEPKSKQDQKLKNIYDYKMKLLEKNKATEANILNMEEEDEQMYKEKELNSLIRCQIAELND